jgi:hydrogenase maturation protease
MNPPRVLVAGVGNVLQADDGFGVRLAHRLQLVAWPDNVRICETGIGGIHLVQELMEGFDVLVVLDAVDRQREPGTVMVIEPEVVDVHEMNLLQKHDMLADMHLATPARAMMVAKALKVLPDKTFILGCQPVTVNRLEIGLHHVVEHALTTATKELRRLLTELGAVV